MVTLVIGGEERRPKGMMALGIGVHIYVRVNAAGMHTIDISLSVRHENPVVQYKV